MSRIIRKPGVISGGIVYLETAITSIFITANTHNLIIPDIDTFSLVEMSSTGNFNLTGIVPPDTVKAWELKIFNNGVNNIILKNNDLGSLSDNRFLNGGDITCQSQEGFVLIYRPSVKKWSCPGKNI